MMWWWPGMPTWGYALMTISMMLFWGLVVFGVIVLIHHLERRRFDGLTPSNVDIEPIPAAVIPIGLAGADAPEPRRDAARCELTVVPAATAHASA